jgi:transposase-like protein
MRHQSPAHDVDPVEVPSQCPTCRSTDVKAAGKVVDSSSYWRCGSCGEVWNVGRVRPVSRYGYQRPLGR